MELTMQIERNEKSASVKYSKHLSKHLSEVSVYKLYSAILVTILIIHRFGI